jgi:MoaA/NifB/PqqE/SkfB family radical SAM enzyme
MINKQIHKNELKLRILMTNGCTKNCSFCLNDFQKKPINNSPQYLNAKKAEQIIGTYANLFQNQYPLQIYFSGGEPTIHKNLFSLLAYAKLFKARTTLNTNGFDWKQITQFINYIDCLHIGTYEIDNYFAKKIKELNADIQCVYPYISEKFIHFYGSQNIPIKIFHDFFDYTSDYDYINFGMYLKNKYPDFKLSFRHTGIQENRGQGCNGCKKRCITLKAIWIFPDGGITACPQNYRFQKKYPNWPFEYRNVLKEIELFHKAN